MRSRQDQREREGVAGPRHSTIAVTAIRRDRRYQYQRKRAQQALS
jgi:hypothetical protein